MRRHFLVASIILLTGPVRVLAQLPLTPAEPVTVVREYIAAQNRGDIDRMMSLLADQVVLRTGFVPGAAPETTRTQSNAELRNQFTQMLQRLPGARSEILEVITEGVVVITRERTTGLPNGGSDTGLAIYQVRNGKIDNLWIVSSRAVAANE
jgi:hypothetical protein